MQAASSQSLHFKELLLLHSHFWMFVVVSHVVSWLFGSAPPPEEQQIPDGKQAFACAAGEERHEGDVGHCWKRGFLVLHPAVLQATLHRGQRESSCTRLWESWITMQCVINVRQRERLNPAWDDAYFTFLNVYILIEVAVGHFSL